MTSRSTTWTARCAIAGRCATVLMATRRVLEGGFGDETMASDLPQTNSCAAQSNMLHIRLAETTIASGGLMGDLRWSLGALSRHRPGDGSYADDDEIQPADIQTPINAWCHGHAFTSERGLLLRPSRCFVAMFTKLRTHLRHGVLMSHKYKTLKRQG